MQAASALRSLLVWSAKVRKRLAARMRDRRRIVGQQRVGDRIPVADAVDHADAQPAEDQRRDLCGSASARKAAMRAPIE